MHPEKIRSHHFDNVTQRELYKVTTLPALEQGLVTWQDQWWNVTKHKYFVILHGYVDPTSSPAGAPSEAASLTGDNTP